MDTAADSSSSSAASSAASGRSPAPPPSGCRYENFGDSAVVTLEPELNDVKWDAIESIGNSVEERLTSQQPDKVVFDLTPLTYVGSAMVALVARWWKRVNSNGGQCSVAVADDNVMEVLKLAKLDTHWDIVPSREAAFKKLGVRGGTASAAPRATGGIDAVDHRNILPLLLGLIGATIAGVGLVLFFADAGVARTVVNWIIAAGGAVMAIGGLIGTLKAAYPGRGAHIAFLLLGLALAIGFAMMNLTPNRVGVPDVDIDAPDLEATEEAIEADVSNAAAAVDRAAESAGREIEDAADGAADAARDAGDRLRAEADGQTADRIVREVAD